MNHYSISDGNMRITCPDRYLADQESAETVLLWDPAHPDIPIRVSVITVIPKDPNEYESQRWAVIEKARGRSVQPKIFDNKAVYSYREPAKEEGFLMHYSNVGMGNHYFIFSVTVSAEVEGTEAFGATQADLEGMIESIVERKEEEQFDCCLQESEKKAIQDACKVLIGNQFNEAGWKALQEHYNAALLGEPPKDSGKIGFVFGELLRKEVPSFHWRVKIDEYGRSRSLDFLGAQISIFPESMIWKRIDRKEEVFLKELSSDTIEAVENLFRKYQDGAK